MVVCETDWLNIKIGYCLCIVQKHYSNERAPRGSQFLNKYRWKCSAMLFQNKMLYMYIHYTCINYRLSRELKTHQYTDIKKIAYIKTSFIVSVSNWMKGRGVWATYYYLLVVGLLFYICLSAFVFSTYYLKHEAI